MQTKGLFLVMGMPYSGSTLLSFILGSNAQVYNGADLHHLNPDRKGVCSLHKQDCPVLTPENLEKIYQSFHSCDDWYNNISEATNRPYICDASKQLAFFRDVLPKTQKPFVLIALSKHPMRAIASDLYNRLFARQLKMQALDDIREYIEANQTEVKNFLKNRMGVLHRHIAEREEVIDSAKGKDNMVTLRYLKYEEYVDQPKAVFTELLKCYDLSFEDGFLNYPEYEHHPITGNLAPVWKVREKGRGPRKENKSNFRKSFYLKDDKPIVLDQKYLSLFSADEIAWIQDLPDYNNILEKLQYAPVPDGSEA